MHMKDLYMKTCLSQQKVSANAQEIQQSHTGDQDMAL